MSETCKKYVLYFSSRCEWSQKLLSLIDEHSMQNSFTKINVEFQDNIPEYVTKVPTVIVNSNTKLEGRKIFEWFEQLVDESNTLQPSCIQSDPYSFLDKPEPIFTQYAFLKDNENTQPPRQQPSGFPQSQPPRQQPSGFPQAQPPRQHQQYQQQQQPSGFPSTQPPGQQQQYQQQQQLSGFPPTQPPGQQQQYQQPPGQQQYQQMNNNQNMSMEQIMEARNSAVPRPFKRI